MPDVTSPAEFFGFEPGSPRRLINWTSMVEYFRYLESACDTVAIEEFGVSTEGRPLLAVYISSVTNIQRLNEIKQLQQRLIDPRVTDDAEAARAIVEGRAVVLVTCSMHPAEVGSGQMAPVLAFDLATSSAPEMVEIRDNVVLILIPSLNPDGLDLVHGWYESTLGTSAEGTWPPSITHKYAGGENSYDWSTLTQAEMRGLITRIYNEWFPHVTLDMHQFEPDGFRVAIPPYSDPIDPDLDPIITAQASRIGTAILARMVAAGLSGVALQVYPDVHSPDRNYALYHGGVYLLVETASCAIATPVQVDMKAPYMTDGFDPRVKFAHHPLPWPGGEWSLADIIRYDREVVLGCLIDVARHRQDFLSNFYHAQRRTIERFQGQAFVIRPDQADPVSTAELLEILATGRVEIFRAQEPFDADGIACPAGSYIIPLAQPFGLYAHAILEPRDYPLITPRVGDAPRLPRGFEGYCLPLMIGVKATRIRGIVGTSRLQKMSKVSYPTGKVLGGPSSVYLLSPVTNAAIRAINSLLESGARVHRASAAFMTAEGEWPAGTFVVSGVDHDALITVASRTHTMWQAAMEKPGVPLHHVRMPRIGIYKSYMTGFGVCDEGWLRFVLDQYGFPYDTLHNQDIRSGTLSERYDVVILPQQFPRDIVLGHDPSRFAGAFPLTGSGEFEIRDDAGLESPYPEQYVGGIGRRGVDSLCDFVERGGTLVALDTASDVAIQGLRLPVENAVRSLNPSEFHNPGSLVILQVNNSHPLGYGYGRETVAVTLESPAFRIHGDACSVAAHPLAGNLAAGWARGIEHLRGLSALVDVPLGRGRVVLFGFRPHFRAQARSTYRFLFNALYYSAFS